MRKTNTKDGITIKAFAGTTGVLIAFNVTDAKRKGLLGFSIERRDPETNKWEWMSGMMPFPEQAHDAGSLISTDVAPIQKFRWSDYRVHHETTYSYRVHGMYGTPANPKLVKGPEIRLPASCACPGNGIIPLIHSHLFVSGLRRSMEKPSSPFLLASVTLKAIRTPVVPAKAFIVIPSFVFVFLIKNLLAWL